MSTVVRPPIIQLARIVYLDNTTLITGIPELLETELMKKHTKGNLEYPERILLAAMLLHPRNNFEQRKEIRDLAERWKQKTDNSDPLIDEIIKWGES